MYISYIDMHDTWAGPQCKDIFQKFEMFPKLQNCAKMTTNQRMTTLSWF